jgi:hypothetical protein
LTGIISKAKYNINIIMTVLNRTENDFVTVSEHCVINSINAWSGTVHSPKVKGVSMVFQTDYIDKDVD